MKICKIHNFSENKRMKIRLYFLHQNIYSFSDAPVVEISPTNLTAIEGEEVMILCTYDSNPSLLTAVRW